MHWLGRLNLSECTLSVLHIEIYWSDRLWSCPGSPGQQDAASRYPNSAITRQMAATFITTTSGPDIYYTATAARKKFSPAGLSVGEGNWTTPRFEKHICSWLHIDDVKTIIVGKTSNSILWMFTGDHKNYIDYLPRAVNHLNLYIWQKKKQNARFVISSTTRNLILVIK